METGLGMSETTFNRESTEGGMRKDFGELFDQTIRIDLGLKVNPCL